MRSRACPALLLAGAGSLASFASRGTNKRLNNRYAGVERIRFTPSDWSPGPRAARNAAAALA